MSVHAVATIITGATRATTVQYMLSIDDTTGTTAPTIGLTRCSQRTGRTGPSIDRTAIIGQCFTARRTITIRITAREHLSQSDRLASASVSEDNSDAYDFLRERLRSRRFVVHEGNRTRC